MKFILSEPEKEEYDNLIKRFNKEVDERVDERVGEENKSFWGGLIILAFFAGIILMVILIALAN